MREKNYIFTALFILWLFTTCTYALGATNLCFDTNGDGIKDTHLELEPAGQNKINLGIWLENWNNCSFAEESLFGVEMYLFYDHKKISVNKENSFANDTKHGGPFSPDFIIFNNLGVGIIQLEVANFNCVEIKDRLLLYTLELQASQSGNSEIEITVDYPTGSVTPGGPECKKPHTENSAGQILIVNSNGDEIDEDEEEDDKETGDSKSVAGKTQATTSV